MREVGQHHYLIQFSHEVDFKRIWMDACGLSIMLGWFSIINLLVDYCNEASTMLLGSFVWRFIAYDLAAATRGWQSYLWLSVETVNPKALKEVEEEVQVILSRHEEQYYERLLMVLWGWLKEVEDHGYELMWGRLLPCVTGGFVTGLELLWFAVMILLWKNFELEDDVTMLHDPSIVLDFMGVLKDSEGRNPRIL